MAAHHYREGGRVSKRLAYLCLQATTEGQASYAHVHEIINGLREEGWEVDLYEPSYAGSESPGPLARLLEFRRVQNRLLGNLRDYDALYVRAHPLARYASRAAKWIGTPTVQECNGPYEDLFLAWPAARPFGRIFIHMAKEQYRNASALIAVTPQLAEWLRAETGRKDIRVVPNGANTGVFTPDAPRPDGLPEHYVVFFGALAPWQGVGTCLAAVKGRLWPGGVSLVIVGDGALQGSAEVAASTMPERVRYLGRMGYHEVPGVVAGATASLVPMHQPERDNRGLSPLKLFESMACGVPVIVSDLPGLSDVVDEAGSGIRVRSGDADALALAVAELAWDPKRAAEMGHRGRTYVTEHGSWRARAAATAAVIDAAVDKGRTTASR